MKILPMSKKLKLHLSESEDSDMEYIKPQYHKVQLLPVIESSDLDLPQFCETDFVNLHDINSQKSFKFCLHDMTFDKFKDACGKLLGVNFSSEGYINIFHHPDDSPHLLAANDEDDFENVLSKILKPSTTVYVGKHEFIREVTLPLIGFFPFGGGDKASSVQSDGVHTGSPDPQGLSEVVSFASSNFACLSYINIS